MRTPHNIRHALTGLVLAASVLGSACRQAPQAQTPQALPTGVQELQTSTVEESSKFVGNLKAVQRAEVRAEIQGRIEEIRVASGDFITAGETIMILSPDQTVPQLETATAGIDQAKAAKEAAIAQKQVAEKQLEVARANRDSVQATLNLEQVNFERATFLLDQGAIGRFDYDRAETNVKVARNNLDSAEDQIQQVQATITQADASIAQADATINQAQSEAATAAVSVEFKDITAPISGFLTDISLRVGDFVTANQPIVTISEQERFELRFSVPGNRVSDLRLGLPVELIDPDSRQMLSTGSLNFVSPTIDPTGQVIQAKAEFSNVNGNLRDGQFVEARVIWSESPGLLIPTTSISRISGESFVYVVGEEQPEEGPAQTVVRLTPVELGDIQGSSYQVKDGLEAGDTIAVSNLLRLRDGTPIEPKTASGSI